ncbi:GNAT family N-acetyltransferase [Solicola gregarius]|uniref:GNAT family N-acetyltransferase n=1 Tax=Solicola gregarius TaxID=2908642 RepID=A0AA46TKM3_9ACTN|nr:GNAT family protein [Solicola gregarius]UYM06632.1 GNAT family N-acetyltransferase [Solicola gregarius]
MRPLNRRDAGSWQRLHEANRAWLQPWEATVPHGSRYAPQTFRRLVRSLRQQARDGRAMPFAICYDGPMVGQLTVAGVTWGSARWAQIGYWIAESHAGRGLTTLAVAMAVDHCFSAVGLHRIEIAIRPENAASLRVVQKLGFTEVGLSRAYLHIDGDWRDHLLFAMTVEEAGGRLVDRVVDAADV